MKVRKSYRDDRYRRSGCCLEKKTYETPTFLPPPRPITRDSSASVEIYRAIPATRRAQIYTVRMYTSVYVSSVPRSEPSSKVLSPSTTRRQLLKYVYACTVHDGIYVVYVYRKRVQAMYGFTGNDRNSARSSAFRPLTSP